MLLAAALATPLAIAQVAEYTGEPGEQLGGSLSIDPRPVLNDGWFMIGSPAWNSNQGRLNVVRVETGNALIPFGQGTAPGSVYGASVAAIERYFSGSTGLVGYHRRIFNIGDVTNDGLNEGAFTLPNGQLLTFSANGGIGIPIPIVGGSPIIVLNDLTTGARIGDIDDDGVSDFAVTAPVPPLEGGRIVVLSGADFSLIFEAGGLLATQFPGVYSDNLRSFGYSVASAGDFDGDGVPDVVVGAPANTSLGVSGIAVYSGSARGLNAQPIFLATGAAGLWAGHSVASAGPFGTDGDIDGDGFGDLIVGGPGSTFTDRGNVWIISGRAGVSTTPMQLSVTNAAYQGSQFGSRFGWAVTRAVDADNDGRARFAVSAPTFDVNISAGGQEGRVYIYEIPLSPSNRAYTNIIDDACVTSSGSAPRADLDGPPRPGANLEFQLRGSLPGQAAALWFASDQQTVDLTPFGLTDCRSHLGPTATPIDLAVAGANGRAGLAATVPPALLGATFLFQWLVLDPTANPSGVVTSDAIEAVVGS